MLWPFLKGFLFTYGIRYTKTILLAARKSLESNFNIEAGYQGLNVEQAINRTFDTLAKGSKEISLEEAKRIFNIEGTLTKDLVNEVRTILEI
jgi:hypothetical protein